MQDISYIGKISPFNYEEQLTARCILIFYTQTCTYTWATANNYLWRIWLKVASYHILSYHIYEEDWTQIFPLDRWKSVIQKRKLAPNSGKVIKHFTRNSVFHISYLSSFLPHLLKWRWSLIQQLWSVFIGLQSS